MLQEHKITFNAETPLLVKEFYKKLVERMEQAELEFDVEVVDVKMENLIKLYGTKQQFNFLYKNDHPGLDITFKLCDFWYGTGGTDREWLNIETFFEEMDIVDENEPESLFIIDNDCDIIHEESTEEDIDEVIDKIIKENLKRKEWGYK